MIAVIYLPRLSPLICCRTFKYPVMNAKHSSSEAQVTENRRTNIRHWSVAHNDWLRALKFYKDEIDILRLGHESAEGRGIEPLFLLVTGNDNRGSVNHGWISVI